jgi:hypothetical protein
VIEVPASRRLNLATDTTVFLMAVKNCETTSSNLLDMHFYTKSRRIDMVDITCLQCLVARVKDKDRNVWQIFDRSGTLSWAVHQPDDLQQVDHA